MVAEIREYSLRAKVPETFLGDLPGFVFAQLLLQGSKRRPSLQGRTGVAEGPQRLPEETHEASGDHEAGQENQ